MCFAEVVEIASEEEVDDPDGDEEETDKEDFEFAWEEMEDAADALILFFVDFRECIVHEIDAELADAEGKDGPEKGHHVEDNVAVDHFEALVWDEQNSEEVSHRSGVRKW